MNRRLKWILAVAFLLVFAAGAATGSYFGGHYFRKHKKRVVFMGPPGAMGERMQEHLRRQLELTPEQAEKVSPIIVAASSRLQAIRTETNERVRATMDEAHREMAPHLTAEQQTKLTELREQHRHRLKMRRWHRHAPEPPPHEQPEE